MAASSKPFMPLIQHRGKNQHGSDSDDEEFHSNTTTLRNGSTDTSDDSSIGSGSGSRLNLLKVVAQPSIPGDGTESASAAIAAAATGSTVDQSSTSKKPSDEAPVTWLSLPCKTQLAVLTIARLSEPLSERSLAAYMFYQLRWFNPSLPDSTIASQGGMMTASFAAAQFLTAVLWGRAADSPRIGRKRVLLVGLAGTTISCIGVGFSRSFAQAVFFRSIAGALNGNIGVMRTMISEIIVEKKFQSRAFLLLPMCFNIGVIIGPMLGGWLADPITTFPDTFGPGGALGGKDGVGWMRSFPYALPNLFSAVFIGISTLAVILGLDETHDMLKNKPDHGRRLGKWLASKLFGKKMDRGRYRMVHSDDHDDDNHTARDEEEEAGTELTERPTVRSDVLKNGDNTTSAASSTPPTTGNSAKATTASSTSTGTHHRRKGFSLILHTPNVLLTLLTHFFLALHISAFNALIFLFLPAPRSHNNPLQGGLGLPQSQVALSLTILGIIGLPLQLTCYPRLSAVLGPLKCYRSFLPFSVLAYAALPLLVLIPSSRPPLMWLGMVSVIAAQVLSRTFALTGSVILVNNSVPSRDVLGTVHGVAQSVSSAARCLGPTVGGWVLGWGLHSVGSSGQGQEGGSGNVGVVFWGMAGIATLNWICSWAIYEGDGNGGKG